MKVRRNRYSKKGCLNRSEKLLRTSKEFTRYSQPKKCLECTRIESRRLSQIGRYPIENLKSIRTASNMILPLLNSLTKQPSTDSVTYVGTIYRNIRPSFVNSKSVIDLRELESSTESLVPGLNSGTEITNANVRSPVSISPDHINEEIPPAELKSDETLETEFIYRNLKVRPRSEKPQKHLSFGLLQTIRNWSNHSLETLNKDVPLAVNVLSNPACSPKTETKSENQNHSMGRIGVRTRSQLLKAKLCEGQFSLISQTNNHVNE